MAEEENPIGPVGEQVRENIERLRAQRGLSIKDLSGWTKFVGHAVPTPDVLRIEAGVRRVDVDDLVALATALGVTPTVLLEPPGRLPNQGDGFRGTRLAEELLDAVRDVVNPGPDTDVSARVRTARRLIAQIGLELDEIADARRLTAEEDRYRGRRHHRMTDEHLIEVAAVYRDAVRGGRPPTMSVAEHFRVSHSASAKWVGLARAGGHLGATQKGKSGEGDG